MKGGAVAERRRFQRARRRIACSLEWKGGGCAGWVSDLSANGLQVQMRALPPTGSVVSLRLRLPDGVEVSVSASVVRIRRAHPSAQAIVTPVAGLQIMGAPEAYFQLLTRVGEPIQEVDGR